MIYVLIVMIVALLVMVFLKNSTIDELKADVTINKMVALDAQKGWQAALDAKKKAKQDLELAELFGSQQFKRANNAEALVKSYEQELSEVEQKLENKKKDLEAAMVYGRVCTKMYNEANARLAKYDRPRDPETGRIIKKPSH